MYFMYQTEAEESDLIMINSFLMADCRLQVECFFSCSIL